MQPKKEEKGEGSERRGTERSAENKGRTERNETGWKGGAGAWKQEETDGGGSGCERPDRKRRRGGVGQVGGRAKRGEMGGRNPPSATPGVGAMRRNVGSNGVAGQNGRERRGG